VAGFEALSDVELDVAIAEAKMKSEGQQALSDQELETLIKANTPTAEGQGVTLSERFKVKVLLDNDPEASEQFLKKAGYETRIIDGNLQVRKPGQPAFKAVDPGGFEAQDILDVAGDVLETGVDIIATGAKVMGFLGAPITGGASIPAGMALGGAVSTGFETARQGVAMAAGAREELDPGRIGLAGVTGAIMPGIGSLVETGIKKIGGKAIGEVTERLAKTELGERPDAAAIKEAAETLGVKPTRGQLSKSDFVRALENEQLTNPTLLSRITNKETGETIRIAREQQEVFKGVIDDITSKLKPTTAFEAGEAASRDVLERVSAKQAKAEVLYDQFDEAARDIALSKEAKKAVIDEIDRMKQFVKTDLKQVKELENLKKGFKKAETISDLKGFRSTVGQKVRRQELAGVGELYTKITNTRNKALLDASGEIAERVGKTGDVVQKEIATADELYKGAIDDLSKALGVKKKKAQTPVSALSEALEKSSPEAFARKQFNLKNLGQVKEFQKRFPEAFEELRENKIKDLIQKSTTGTKFSDTRFVNSIQKLDKEAQHLLFGEDGALKLKAIAKLKESFPSEFTNFSNTARQQNIKETLSVMNQLKGIGRAKLLDFIADPNPKNPIIKIAARRPVTATAKQIVQEQQISEETRPKSLRTEFLRQK
jgi:hypothetical protein